MIVIDIRKDEVIVQEGDGFYGVPIVRPGDPMNISDAIPPINSDASGTPR